MKSQSEIERKWGELTKLEPKLEELRQKARRYMDANPEKLDTDVYYALMKPAIYKLVGWGREDKDQILASAAAYDLAVSVIYSEVCKSEKVRKEFPGPWIQANMR